MRKSRNNPDRRAPEARTFGDRRRKLAEWCETLESRALLSASPSGLTPAQVRAAYGFNSVSFTTASGSVVGDGSGQTIAIVDAYVSSTITSDLDVFDKAFSLTSTSGTLYSDYGAASSFLTVHNMASKSSKDAGWALETALDVEWAHAIAPGADIVLVEASSSSLDDLLSAVTYAKSLSGVSVVSMSWGTTEFSTETSFDSNFTTPSGHQGITFVASAGDTAGTTSWPAVSYNVLSVGGTTLSLNADGSYKSETAWNSSGGGKSAYESEGTYQSAVDTSGKRWSPDVAYDAATSSGFSVYTATSQSGQTGWFTVGGTSAGAPQWAALVAIADQGRALSGLATLDGATQTLPALYGLSSSDFHDVTSGSSGRLTAGKGYDTVTGLGSPIANLVIAGLVDSATTTSGGTTSGGSSGGGSSGGSSGGGSSGGGSTGSSGTGGGGWGGGGGFGSGGPGRSPWGYGGLPRRGISGRFPMARGRAHAVFSQTVATSSSSTTRSTDAVATAPSALATTLFSRAAVTDDRGQQPGTSTPSATTPEVFDEAPETAMFASVVPVIAGAKTTATGQVQQMPTVPVAPIASTRSLELANLSTLTEVDLNPHAQSDLEPERASLVGQSGWHWLVASVLGLALLGRSKKDEPRAEEPSE